MIALHYNTEDPYRIYGINHFIQKYGIRMNINTGSKINIIYGHTKDNIYKDITGFNIQIIENDMRNNISGYLKTDAENIPLFEKPIRLNKYEEYEETLVMFDDKENEYPCVVLGNNSIIFGFDIFNEVGHILSGHLDTLWKSKASESQQMAKIPIIDYYEKILFDCLNFTANKLNIKLNVKPFWPNEKKFAVCLTHDVDRVRKTYQYFTHLIQHLKKRNYLSVWNQVKSLFLRLLYQYEPYWCFEKILKLENELKVKSTFFFLNEQEKPYLFNIKSWMLFTGRYNINNPDIIKMIKKLHESGWEIGLHGSYNSYNSETKLKTEKNDLEMILGKKVQGIRQHYLNLKIPETWMLQEKVGFKYDTTLGFRDNIGFRWGTCFPFQIKDQFLLEIPLIIMDVVFRSQKKNILNECKKILEIVEKTGGVLTLLWHQSIFNEREYPELCSVYVELIKLCKEKDAWITNLEEIYNWWNERSIKFK